MKTVPLKKTQITIVSPVYNAQNWLIHFYTAILSVLKSQKYNYNIFLVDDGSQDNSWKMIQQLHESDRNVTGIRLSKNFGQHKAILAGLRECELNSKYYIIMDSDLQDDPSDILKMLESAREGAEIVHSHRIKRADKWVIRFLIKMVHFVLALFSDLPRHKGVGNFKLISHKVLEAYRTIQNPFPIFEADLSKLGFPQKYISVKRNERVSGKSGYNLRKWLSFVIPILFHYSYLPAILILFTGLVCIFFPLSFFFLFQNNISDICLAAPSYLMTTIIFEGGVILVALALIAMYLRSIQNKLKNWPVYVIHEKIH